jgi:hypothetical protein
VNLQCKSCITIAKEDKDKKQTSAELCQAQDKLWLAKPSNSKKLIYDYQKIASYYFSILRKNYFLTFFLRAIFTEIRISGDFWVGQTAVRAGQTVFQAGLSAKLGWTPCPPK